MDIQYGIKITTGQGISDPTIGLSSGVIQWITGRSGVSGWKEGIISKGSFSPVSQEIEIAAGGSYATMSGFSLAARPDVDGTPMWKIIETLGLNLVQKEIIFYTFRDGVPTQDWTGRVGDYESDEKEFKIQCMDAFRSIHKTICKTKVNPDAFPSAPMESIGKSIPVTIGYLAKAPLASVAYDPEKTTMAVVNSAHIKVCAATAYDATGIYVDLYTLAVTFSLNDASLVGKNINVVSGGASQSRKIISNLVTSADTTRVYIDDPLDVDGAAFVAWSAGTTSDSVWYFQVAQNKVDLIVSNLAIDDVIENTKGLPILYRYDSSAKEYVDISSVGILSSESDVGGTGYPGFRVVSDRIDADGSVFDYTPITISSITLESYGSGFSGTPIVGDPLPNLIDGDSDSYYVFSGTNPSGLELMVTLPDGIQDYDDLYLLFDYDHKFSASAPMILAVTYTTFDVYGRDLDPVVSSHVVQNISLGTSYVGLSLIAGGYYGLAGSEPEFYQHKAALSISSVLGNIKKAVAFPKIKITFEQVSIGSHTYDLRLREVAVVGKKTISYKTEALYAKVTGETTQSTWGGRKTSGQFVNNIADALEHAMREYDEAGEYIDAGAFDELHSVSGGGREEWLVGKQFSSETEVFKLAEEAARFGVFGIIPKNNGKRAPVSWLDTLTETATHGSASIINRSIGTRELTDMSRVYNELEVNFDWNPAENKFNKFLRVTRINESSFPAESDPAWKTFAIGFPDDRYSLAAEIWAHCHRSYLRYGVIRRLPDELSNCSWAPSMDDDWGLNWGYSVAVNYLYYMSLWVPYRKTLVSYKLPNTAANASLELLNLIIFNDSFATNGEDVAGWIVRKSIVPGDGSDGKDYIEITLMLAPDTTG